MIRYRNVICPWQTMSEIKAQVKFLRKMEFTLIKEGWTKERLDSLLGLDKPDHKWK